MFSLQSSHTRKGKSRKGASSGGPRGGGGRVQTYLHAVTDVSAACLENTGNREPLKDVAIKTGADVQFDENSSPVPGMKIINIRGFPSQIEAAVRLISQITGAKGTLSEEAQKFWLRWVEDCFPDLDSRAYFLPPVNANRISMHKRPFAGQDTLILQIAPGKACQSDSSQAGQPAPGQAGQSASGQAGQSASGQAGQPQKSTNIVTQTSILEPLNVFDSDVRDDAAMQRVLFFLQKISEENKEVLFGMSQLQFGDYLGEPCYAAAAAQLPVSASLPPFLPKNWKRGDFDVLLIHRHYGLIVCEVKSFGSITKELNMSQQDADSNTRKKVSQAVSQLDKAEAMLSHLVSDIAPGLRITKTIAVPNLTAYQVQRAISGDQQLTQDLCRCLRTTDPATITGLCLCYDYLDPKTPLDSSEDLLRELGNWWQRCVAGAGNDSHMTCDLYKTLVARFCGPATTVTVPCTSPPRLCIKTLGQAVFLTGQCYTAEITLFPEQFQLLITAPPRLFVAGPPGTGKTVVLQLMGTEWLRCGEDVYIVSTGFRSRSTSRMLCHLLKQTPNTQHIGKLHLLEYDFYYGKDVEKAVNDLSQKAKGGSLYVIADEVRHDCKAESHFPTFCEKLLTQVPNLHLWAASYFHEFAPKGWQVEHLTRPLRSPPTVIREVKKDTAFVLNSHLRAYSERGVPDHTDGPPVKRLYHNQDESHSGYWPADCVTCGREVASFLRSLRVVVPVNVPTTSTTAASTNCGTVELGLRCKDVLVLSWGDVDENCGMVTALSQGGFTVRVMKDNDTEDVATARSDVVWVANGRRVLGLERKVVVCLESRNLGFYAQLDLMSRCTSQLVIVSRRREQDFESVYVSYGKEPSGDLPEAKTSQEGKDSV